MIRCPYCRNCRFLFKDDGVGYSECTKTDLMTDVEFDEYELFGSIDECPYYMADDYYVPITPLDADSYDTVIRAAQKGLESYDSLKQLYAEYIHEEEPFQPDDPGMDWPDENWPTISEYEIPKKEK